MASHYPHTDQPSDDGGARILYSVVSFTEILLNVAFYRIISSGKYEALGLSWEKSACDLINELRQRKGKSLIRRFSRDPSILELLLHRNGFAPMNEHLFAPDGAFMMSSHEFLDTAPRITEDYYKGEKQGSIEYSNANHIFAALVLEEVTELPLHKVMQQEVFSPLQMLHTAIDNVTLQQLQDAGCIVATGYRVAGDMRTRCPLARRMYLDDSTEAASLGAYSCTEDLAKLIREFLNALDDVGNTFTKSDTTFFFGPKAGHRDGPSASLAGLRCVLNSDIPGCESTNRDFSPVDQRRSYQLGTLKQRHQCNFYYKAGSIHGFSCTVYISLNFRMFVIILANASSPLDVTDHLAKYVLQEALVLNPRVDIVDESRKEAARNSRQVQDFEKVDSESSLWADDIQDLVGIYVHEILGGILEITRDGGIIFRRESKCSSRMNVGRLGDRLRIFPGSEGFSIDRWSVWKNRDYLVHQRGEEPFLIRLNDIQGYRRTG